MLRKHQKEMDTIISEIIIGEPINEILCKVTPGGGKSMLPLIAGRLLIAGLAKKICWVVPRKNLQEQGESNFVDPFFRKMIGHNLTVRSSTNEVNACRGLDGFVTTYQAIGFDDGKSVLSEFKKQDFILILDEFHHVEKDGIWHKALEKIVQQAKFVVYMTGTIERGDGKEIAFLKYNQVGKNKKIPSIQNTENLRVINYTRKDALKERAILPLKFFLSDGEASWIDKEGNNQAVEKISKANITKVSQAIFTVLHSNYAGQLLRKAVNHWQNHRIKNNRSKLLIVTADYEMATEISNKLSKAGFNCSIATSHESIAANISIRNFKKGSIDILVTIAMAYEGLDCPEITHTCCLTNIRSSPWIEQMVARGVRVDKKAGPYRGQTAFVFAPDDMLFRKIVKQLEQEQLPFIEYQEKELFEPGIPEEGEDFMMEEVQIVPLDSSLFGGREMDINNSTFGTPDDFEIIPQTPKIIETDLRKRIESHVRMYDFKNRNNPGYLNRKIKEEFFKSRSIMTIPELEKVLKYINKQYPLNKVRGTGKRVTTKVLPFVG